MHRSSQIPEPIKNVAYDNAAVHTIMDMYAHGHIITVEEMLCQMVIALNTNWAQVKKDYMDTLLMQTTFPGIVKPR